MSVNVVFSFNPGDSTFDIGINADMRWAGKSDKMARAKFARLTTVEPLRCHVWFFDGVADALQIKAISIPDGEPVVTCEHVGTSVSDFMYRLMKSLKHDADRIAKGA